MPRKRKTYKKAKKKRVIAGITYTLKMCYKLKTNAKKRAKKIKAKKKHARVIRVQNKHCVYAHG